MTKADVVEPAVAEDLSALFDADSLVRLHGNLYRVKRSLITFAESGVQAENGSVKFGNPRWVKGSKGKPLARGLEKVKMEDLKASNQDQGLENPLRLRLLEEGEGFVLQLVNGERRFRSISMLVEEKAECLDPASKTKSPADELYEWVDCRINRMSEEEALEHSLRPNETGESIGEVAAIEVVRVLRSIKKTDDEIRKITGKSVTWLRETDRLLSLDSQCMSALQSDQINRNLALKLSEISDANHRIERMQACSQKAIERIAAQEAALRDAAQKDAEEAEISAGAATVADALGSPESAKKHRRKASGARVRADKKTEARKQLADGPKTATSKDWDSTAGNAPETNPALDTKALSVSKIEKHWQTDLAQIVKKQGKDVDGNDLEIDLDDAKLAKSIVDAIVTGKREPDNKTPIAILKILKAHFKKKNK